MICEQNQSLRFYWKVLATGQTFKNRKEAKDTLGMAKFKIMLRTGEIRCFNENN